MTHVIVKKYLGSLVCKVLTTKNVINYRNNLTLSAVVLFLARHHTTYTAWQFYAHVFLNV